MPNFLTLLLAFYHLLHWYINKGNKLELIFNKQYLVNFDSVLIHLHPLKNKTGCKHGLVVNKYN